MIETILSGLPAVKEVLAIAFGIVCLVAGLELCIKRLWDYNRLLGLLGYIVAYIVCCIVVAVLASSYFVGMASG